MDNGQLKLCLDAYNTYNKVRLALRWSAIPAASRQLWRPSTRRYAL